jgi:hypothetical protein
VPNHHVIVSDSTVCCLQPGADPTDTESTSAAKRQWQAITDAAVDQVMHDPGVPPYRFRVEVTDGWFKLEGNRYEQSMGFYELAEGYPGRRWRWSESGTCAWNDDTRRCESGFIQNYVFDLKRRGNAFITEQAFKDPILKGTYSFSR